MKLKRLIKGIFLPERCRICGRIKPFMKPCERCRIDTIPISSLACPDCGHEKCMCHSGANVNLPHFTAVYYYQGQLKKSLLRFKFMSESNLCHPFSEAMAKRITEVYPGVDFDGVCYVPMTKTDERIRGYNQSELLAKGIAKRLNLSLVPCLEKTKDTHAQKDLTAEERQLNVKNCFKAKDKYSISGKTLILCDDIKTTGATLRECSDALMRTEAKDVYCICLAITPYLDYTDPF